MVRDDYNDNWMLGTWGHRTPGVVLEQCRQVSLAADVREQCRQLSLAIDSYKPVSRNPGGQYVAQVGVPGPEIVLGSENDKRPRDCSRGLCLKICPATTYSPTGLPLQYHRR